jgi:hypothetical protein
VSNNGLTLANEIRNQMLYYKVLRDKHDNSLINTLQDLNNLLQTGGNQKGANTTIIHQNNENITDSQQELGSSEN